MPPRRRLLAAAAALSLLGLAGCAGDSVLDLQVGDCLDQSDLEGEEISSIQPVDCAEEHDAEIFAEHVFTEEDHPGDDAVQQQSQEACTAQFEEFIGLPYAESVIPFTMLYPSEQSWNDADDRTTLCVALAEEPMTRSLEGAEV